MRVQLTVDQVEKARLHLMLSGNAYIRLPSEPGEPAEVIPSQDVTVDLYQDAARRLYPAASYSVRSSVRVAPKNMLHITLDTESVGLTIESKEAG